jgi:CubicO group peptidase (beta-lactamase class C family)
VSPELHGFCDDRFAPVRDAFRRNFEDGLEVGASLAITLHGEPVADLWAGWADAARTRPWERDTIVGVSSTTKIMVTLCLLMLVDRGRIDLEAPIASYWPEFAAGGKERVTVLDLLTYQAGAPGFTPPVEASLLRDWQGSVARVAAEPHWFDGQRRVVYHEFTQGLIVGELIRRVDGRTPARFFREEVAEPAGLDFHFGAAEVPDPGCIGEVVRPPPPPPPQPGLLARLLGSVVGLQEAPAWTTMNPSANGVTNARAIARGCAIFACGGQLDGVRYLSEALVNASWQEHACGECPYLGQLRLGLGVGLNGTDFIWYPSSDGYGWGGYGGSIGWMDTRLAYSIGYAPNNFVTPDPPLDKRAPRLSKAMRAALADLAA